VSDHILSARYTKVTKFGTVHVWGFRQDSLAFLAAGEDQCAIAVADGHGSHVPGMLVSYSSHMLLLPALCRAKSTLLAVRPSSCSRRTIFLSQALAQPLRPVLLGRWFRWTTCQASALLSCLTEHRGRKVYRILGALMLLGWRWEDGVGVR
jgi:hypothetical protein